MKRFLLKIITFAFLFCIISSNVSAEGFKSDFNDINSKALYMIEAETDNIICSYNADEKLPIASLTKIMTYIVAVENIPNIETTQFTVTKDVSTILASTGSAMGGIKVGETYTGIQLLNLMMIPSGNDASLVLSMFYDQTQGFDNEFKGNDENGIDKRAFIMENSPFVELMNEKADELGCHNTHFTNPHGLHHENHYSTARDMATISKYATQLPYFTDIVNTLEYTFSPVNSNAKKTVYTTNKMFSYYQENGKYHYPYVTGIKTGVINESGYCIASSAAHDGKAFITIALGAPYLDENQEIIEENGAMIDVKNLYKWSYGNLLIKTVFTKEDLIGSIPIDYAWGKDTLNLSMEENIKLLVPDIVNKANLTIKLDIPKKIQAPVSKGDYIGTAEISYMGNDLGKVNVVANESISLSEIAKTFSLSVQFLTSPTFIIVVVSIILLIALYVGVVFFCNKTKNKITQKKS